MSTVYDLHTHSLASDGTLSPAALVEAASQAGVNVLALTDHDETAGLDEAHAAAIAEGIRLVPGIELSVTWNGATVHVVGLRIDPAAAVMQDGIERQQAFRAWRAEEMGRRLAKRGFADAYEQARSRAGGRIIGRMHFANALVASGRAKDARDAFKHYLKRGKPGHVPGQWAALGEAIGWITASGGCAVLAHAARYDLSGSKLRRLIGEFKDAGGTAIEVLSGSHGRDDVLNMARHARNFQLLASVGSDYHGPESPWVGLGRLPPLPEGLTPVWADWPSA
jgi:predicted metal-dependent phosphoesterase TrpH